MKKKDISSLKTKSRDELLKMLAERRLDAARTRAEVKAGTQKNLKKVTNLRREIAVILTVLTEKSLMEKEEKEQEPTKKEEK